MPPLPHSTLLVLNLQLTPVAGFVGLLRLVATVGLVLIAPLAGGPRQPAGPGAAVGPGAVRPLGRLSSFPSAAADT